MWAAEKVDQSRRVTGQRVVGAMRIDEELMPAPTNILLVDDSPDKLLALSVALAELGQNIVTAQSGREALRHVMHQEFAVILLDVHMPEMDGFETASLIRQYKKSSQTPIIFITAYDDDTHAAQGYSLGAVDYILAPVVPEVMRAKVSVFVQLYRQRVQIEEQAMQQLALVQEQAARKTAEAANRMKDEFLAILSHELRTPLSAILGWVQLLKMGERSEADVNSGLEVIDRNARAQEKIIESLLDVSRIISGKLPLELRPVNVAEIVNAAIATIGPEVEAKQLTLTSESSELPLVDADPTRLQQVIWNLLSNAVKFSRAGDAIIVVTKQIEESVEVSVRDSGEGIPAEFLPYVFDRFRQADASTTRRHGGLGLGLAIVRQLVEMHGGQVAATSQGAGRGSMFTVRLPIKSEESPPAEAGNISFVERAVVYSDSCLSGIRVVVVDDEPDARQLVNKVLTREGAEVVVAASTFEALACVARRAPDIVVSDIGMPGQDGYVLVRELRKRFSAAVLPAIALTAYARPEERQLALDSGFQMHLTKPLNVESLINAVSQLATKSQSERDGAIATNGKQR
jgi:signal transduction histidine kinase